MRRVVSPLLIGGALLGACRDGGDCFYHGACGSASPSSARISSTHPRTMAESDLYPLWRPARIAQLNNRTTAPLRGAPASAIFPPAPATTKEKLL